MSGLIKLVNLKLSPELVHNLLERSHIRIQKLLICDDEKIFSLFHSNAPDYTAIRLMESKNADLFLKDPADAIVVNEKWLLTHFNISLKEILTLKIPLIITSSQIEDPNYFLRYQFKDTYVYVYDLPSNNSPVKDTSPSKTTQFITVKMISNCASGTEMCKIFSKMCTHPSSSSWNQIRITDQDRADYYCIINYPRPNDFYVPEKTIVFRMEDRENAKTFFPPEWLDIDHNRFMYYYDTRNTLEWHLSKTYNELLTSHPTKTKLISSVTSSEYRLNGHVKRINFLQFLERNNFKLDLYGKTNKFNLKNYIRSLPYHCKDDGILSYKYTIAAENTNETKGYFTEKIVDAILGECLCFYWGCPDLESYLDPMTFIRIDLDRPKVALKIIQDTIASNEWEKRIERIRQQKVKILNEMQMLPVLENIILESRDAPNYYENKLNNFFEHKEKHLHFHGDTYLNNIIDYITSQCKMFIETGTYRGASSGYIARKFPAVTVCTCEPNLFSYRKSVGNLTYKNVQIYNMTSDQMFLELKIDKSFPTIFWLDAHDWNGSTHMLSELKYILANFTHYYIFINDFKVPKNTSQFQYNRTGDDEYSLDYISEAIGNKQLNYYFPNYTQRISIFHPLVGWILITNQEIKQPEKHDMYKYIPEKSVEDATEIATSSTSIPTIATSSQNSNIIGNSIITVDSMLNPITQSSKIVQNSNFLEKNSDIRVVNLERRKDRWMNFVNEAKRVGLSSYQQYKAVDGKELKLTRDIETLFEINPNRPGGKRYTFNHGFNSAVIGCALSHYSLWQQLAENNDKKRNDCMMIFEDDVTFDDNFVSKWNTIYTTIEKDDRWDLIFLGFTDDRGDLYKDAKVYENVYKFNQHPPKVRLHGAGMFGYCIRKRAAIKLIELANILKIQQPIDHFLIDQFDTLCAYKTIPYLVTTDCHFINPNLDTDIQFCKTVLKKQI